MKYDSSRPLSLRGGREILLRVHFRMPKRPRSHVLEDESVLAFRAALPPRWIFRREENGADARFPDETPSSKRLGTDRNAPSAQKTSRFKADGRSSFECALRACDHAYAISFAGFCKPHRKGSYVGRSYDVQEWKLRDFTDSWR